MQIYTASRISCNENVLYPDMIAIDNSNVTYYKGRPIGYETVTIPRKSICGVSMDCHMFFADVIIAGSGYSTIVAHGFKKADAKQIVNALI